MNLYLSYLINKRLKAHSEMVFEGISRGRKKALENWFMDIWVQLELTRDTILAYLDEKELNYEEMIEILREKLDQFEDICELFIINQEGKVNISTCDAHIGRDMSHLANYKRGLSGEPLMYGPYIDKDTLDIDNSDKKFSDEITLMFSLPYENKHNGRKPILCARVLNDVMSDVIQDEDTHIYKESGDNYLFMVKSNRGIAPGTAISRSRFEDNTFTLGDNLKDGVRTKKWGVVKIKNHTEFEIIFNDPATQSLHPGVQKTIQKGENLDCWPGYPDYRHIMVGGKGTLINPPFCDETWGMMCEGDIAEIYNFRSINLKIPTFISGISGALLLGNYFLSSLNIGFDIWRLIGIWLITTLTSIFITKKLIVTPLNSTINILQEIAEGEGDLTMRVDKLSNDEIGELSRWFNKFINNQMSLIKRVGSAAKDSKRSAVHLSTLTEDVKSSTKIIEKTVSDFLDQSQEQNEVFNTTKDKFQAISHSLDQMNELIGNVNTKTSNTNEAAIKTSDSSKDVLNSINELEQIMKNTLESINILQKYSQEISQVVNVINGISKQTQLLSLNASIESARAGEYGKGFGVVAQEISKLAVESSEATISIAKLISSVQSETENTINNVKEIDQKVKHESEAVVNSLNTFKVIQSDITEVSKNIDTISSLVSEQSSQMNEILSTTTEIAAKLDNDTAKNATKSETSLDLVQLILRQTSQVEQASKVLTLSSSNVDEMVNSFKLK
ncbi:MAG: methyl-accepting chemotaxis protein [Bacillota bacterium]|nr:methyl-accepting chemotaxis protein [Bacillota bacterium]